MIIELNLTDEQLKTAEAFSNGLMDITEFVSYSERHMENVSNVLAKNSHS